METKFVEYIAETMNHWLQSLLNGEAIDLFCMSMYVTLWNASYNL